MKKFLLALALAAQFVPNAQAAGESHLYLLNQSLNDVIGGGPSLVSLGGSMSASGYAFTQGQGLSLSNVLTDSDYTIDLSFSFTAVSPYQYRRIIEFKNLATDNGLYARGTELSSTSALNFYRAAPTGGGPANSFEGNTQPITLDTSARVTLTRTTSGLVTAYVNGIQQFDFADGFGQALFSDPTHIAYFFRDENASHYEDPTGVVSYIRIYDTALTGAEVATLTAPAAPVPEPESYALLLAGLGLLGFAARRRATRS